jgi:hypothetical protein
VDGVAIERDHSGLAQQRRPVWRLQIAVMPLLKFLLRGRRLCLLQAANSDPVFTAIRVKTDPIFFPEFLLLECSNGFGKNIKNYLLAKREELLRIFNRAL